MNRIPAYVGLDYHKDSIQVSALNQRGEQLLNRSISNSSTALAGLLERFEVKGIAIEACSGSAALADELVSTNRFSVHLAHAGYVSRLKQSPDKTDCSDARVVADLLRVGYLPRVWHAPQWIRELRLLVRHRQGLVQSRRTTKLRIGALLREQRVVEPSGRWTQRWLQWLAQRAPLSPEGRWVMGQLLLELEVLNQRVVEVERRLEAYVANDSMVAKLMEQPGVGLIIACTLRAEVGRFDRFRSGKQLSNFCGLSPRNASTGKRQADAGLIKQANPQLRSVILQGAHLLMRFDPRWKQLAQQMRGRGKHHCVIVAAVANRWIRSLYHELRLLGLALPQQATV